LYNSIKTSNCAKKKLKNQKKPGVEMDFTKSLIELSWRFGASLSLTKRTFSLSISAKKLVGEKKKEK